MAVTISGSSSTPPFSTSAAVTDAVESTAGKFLFYLIIILKFKISFNFDMI